MKSRIRNLFSRGIEPVPGNKLRLLQNGSEFFPALIAAIDAAQTEIHLETYIFNVDSSAAAVRDALMRAARRGVVLVSLNHRLGRFALAARRTQFGIRLDRHPPRLITIVGELADRLLARRQQRVAFGKRRASRVKKPLAGHLAKAAVEAGHTLKEFRAEAKELAELKVGGKIGSDPLPRYDQFQWGGFLQQSGYATGQLLGENMKFGRMMYYHRILRGSMLEGAYAGFSLEAGKVGNPLVPGNPELAMANNMKNAANTGILLATPP